MRRGGCFRRLAQISISCLTLVLALAACSGGKTQSFVNDLAEAEAASDAVLLPEAPPEREAVDAAELPGEETAIDLLPADQCGPAAGCFGSPCASNGECASGWCVDHMGEGVCTQTCQDECPDGWTCKQLTGIEPDVVFACISNVTHLCRPCATNADCKSDVGAEDVCVSYSQEGSFCGAACKQAEDCPWGFSCKPTQTVDRLPTTQCVADSGVCPCAKKSVALALWTPCEITNDLGTCAGKRSCTQDGLTACDAPIPAPEECNGIDDDCNGQTDEETCDDGNPCTSDICDVENGCLHDPLGGKECTDGNPCTVADMCKQGTCTGTPVLCHDENPCTDDACDIAGGCIFTANTAACDDGDPCTVADECQDKVCAGFKVDCDCQNDGDCLPLDDGDPCNGTLVCDKTKLPYHCAVDENTQVKCEEPGESLCLADQCSLADGKCHPVSVNDGFACNDGNACTMGETCGDGACGNGLELNCNDGNPCTDDLCEPAAGCLHSHNALPCNDGDPCTSGDACAGGGCSGGPPIPCDDGNPCTADACDPKIGCVHPAIEGGCDDGNPCTEGDHCVGPSCNPVAWKDCDDGEPCTSDSCDPALGCVHTLNAALCDDGNVCTLGDHCALGVCTGNDLLDCNDLNPCTNDACDEKLGCQHIPNKAPCDDGNFCTTGDACDQGGCKAGKPTSCDDSDVCTTDVCDPGKALCTHTPVSCDDQNKCTADACDPVAGCKHTEAGCECPPCYLCGCNPVTGDCDQEAVPCDDADPCTTDTCDPVDEKCKYTPKSCNDMDPCTIDSCNAAQGGMCVHVPLDCDDKNLCTDDFCQPGVGCAHSINSVLCDDGDACTTSDVCSLGSCKPGPAKDCNDKNPCTTDSCDKVKGCVHAPIDPCPGVLSVPYQYLTIQQAIDAAANGNTVLVAAGTYTGQGNKDLDFKGKAITVKGEQGAAATKIDCQNAGRGFYFHTAETASAIVDGFTITNCQTSDGAGIYIDQASPVLKNLRIIGNKASGYGGGIYLQGWNNPTPQLTDLFIDGNTAASGGGGVFYKFGSSPTFTRCTITNNATTSGNGGGVCAWDSNGIFINTLIARNTATGTAGVFFHNCTASFTNCTIASNTAGCIEANGKSHTLLNTICWGNGGKEFVFTGGTINATYSDIQGGYGGEGNLNADPKFKSATDFHLQQTSPCRDTGSANAAPADDIDGEPRPQGKGVDIGCDEAPPCQPDCAGKQCGPDGCGGSCGDCSNVTDPCVQKVCDLANNQCDLPSNGPGCSGALYFGGNKAYVEIPHSSSLSVNGTALTVEAWVWFDELASNCMTVVRKGTHQGAEEYWLHKNMGPVDSLHWASLTWVVTVFNAVTAGQWYHYAGVWDGAQARVYLNGVLKQSTAAANAAAKNTDPVRIGIDWDLGCGMHGTIDEVRISSVARYTANFVPQKTFTPDADTMALYHFNEKAGTTVHDASANGNHGTINGAVWTDKVP